MAILLSSQQDYNYYKIEVDNTLIKQKIGERCFLKYCYKLECGCQYTSSCDLEDGETIKNAFHPKVVEEIEKEEFDRLYARCHNSI